MNDQIARPQTAEQTAVRRFAYVLMIAIATAVALARIFSAERVYEPHMHRDDKLPGDWRGAWPETRPEPTPMFGSNDRSRWATVRALVDEKTFVIGRRETTTSLDEDSLSLKLAVGPLPFRDKGVVFDPGWESIDKVKNPKKEENKENGLYYSKFYSSKPPLLPTMVAGEYWLLKKVTGWSIAKQRTEVVGTLLTTINVLPLIVYLWLLARLAERFAASDWSKLFVVTAACFGTLYTPFLNTFNNHTVATTCVVFALYAALSIRAGSEVTWRDNLLYLVAGFFAGFTAAAELPALAFTVLLGAFLFFRSPWRAIVLYGGAALVPLLALEVLNYVALDMWRPAYSEFGGPWYEYEGSLWNYVPGRSRGIDWAKRNGETIPAYAFHLLIGHHGFFSLTPIYLLALFGMGVAVVGLVRSGLLRWRRESLTWSEIGTMTMVLAVVVIGFYIFNASRNYGGVTNGPRWLMWLAPLFLLTMLPAVDRLSASRWGRAVALVLLALSVFSASYSSWNPWRHPWIYDWMNARDLIWY
jgi:hypothetical protein